MMRIFYKVMIRVVLDRQADLNEAHLEYFCQPFGKRDNLFFKVGKNACNDGWGIKPCG